MSGKWEIINNVLTYRNHSGEEFIPLAADLYSLATETYKDIENPDLKCAGNPFTVFPQIKVARYGITINPEITFNNSSGEISLGLFVEKFHSRRKLKVKNHSFPDHVLFDNYFLYFTNYQPIIDWLKNADIQNDGVISLSKYFALIVHAKQFGIDHIIDEVASILSKEENLILKKTPPAGLSATLYTYQEKGFQWIDYMTTEGCGCVLADEMGLGKTLQIIAVLLAQRDIQNEPSLIIAPVSLLENWRREIEKFAPSLNIFVNHGSNRTGFYKYLLKFDVVIISYGSAVSDLSMLQMVNWHLLVLDEAQNIKNPEAQRTASVKKISSYASIAVTGTPFENHVTDIWSIIDFIMPGYLGTLSQFCNEYEDGIDSARKLEPIISPLMIRRRVSEVAKDLPERIDIPQALTMDDSEALLYERKRKEIVNSLGGKTATLASLQILRMYCTHPFIIDKERIGVEDPAEASAKYNRFCEILSEIIEKKEKVILFTSYNKMFEIIGNDVPSRFNIPVWGINGATDVAIRQTIVDEYSSFSGPALLILNPRAAGTGLNITAANHVIHYNLEWNPAIEDQASARSHRRGQKKNVFVWRLYYANTVEDVVNDKLNQKRDISGNVIIGIDGTKKNVDDIIRAIQMTPYRKE